MIKNAEEGLIFQQGENMAIVFMLKALIATHPNPEALRAMVDHLLPQAYAALKKVLPPDLQLFRYEQLLEELIAEIQKS